MILEIKCEILRNTIYSEEFQCLEVAIRAGSRLVDTVCDSLIPNYYVIKRAGVIIYDSQNND